VIPLLCLDYGNNPELRIITDLSDSVRQGGQNSTRFAVPDLVVNQREKKGLEKFCSRDRLHSSAEDN
jgi:hypothetical protein